uniref:Uncharacterized protein n=1 Tax=Anguilla anguilla TaxID=7936 RepID=A0A0E9S8M8_ANGAN
MTVIPNMTTLDKMALQHYYATNGTRLCLYQARCSTTSATWRVRKHRILNSG